MVFSGVYFSGLAPLVLVLRRFLFFSVQWKMGPEWNIKVFIPYFNTFFEDSENREKWMIGKVHIFFWTESDAFLPERKDFGPEFSKILLEGSLAASYPCVQ